jgi:putative oxidoreductase
MSAVQRFLRSEWLAVRLQIALGIVFLMAAWPKLVAPPVFAKNVWAYDMLPDAAVTAMAVFLPAVELVIGLALVLNVMPRAAAWIGVVLLLQFIVALAINAFLRENPVNCSCFELNPAPKTCAMLLWEMKELILRDLGFLLLAGHVIWTRGPSANKPDVTTPATGLE